MALPWTFGVEMEFCVAFIYPHTVPLPDPAETRKLRFKPRRAEIDKAIDDLGLPPITWTTELANDIIYRDSFFDEIMGPTIQRDIAQRLHEAGFPVDRIHHDYKDVSKWQIADEGSIRCPEDTSYHGLGLRSSHQRSRSTSKT